MTEQATTTTNAATTAQQATDEDAPITKSKVLPRFALFAFAGIVLIIAGVLTIELSGATG